MALGPAASVARSELDSRLVPGTTYYLGMRVSDPGANGNAPASLAAFTTYIPVKFDAATTTAAVTSKVNSALINCGTVTTNETWSHCAICKNSDGTGFIESTTVSGGQVFGGTSPTIAKGAIVLQRTNAN